MENRLRAYESFINQELSSPTMNHEALISYHESMLKSFQHERLIHLIITLFFATITLALIFLIAWLTCVYGFLSGLIPSYILIFILATLTGFYVKHYYFLENHIQKLYDVTKKLYTL